MNESRDVLNYLHSSRDHASTIATVLAGVFNFLAIVSVCAAMAVLLPRISDATTEAQKSFAASEKNQRLLEENRQQMLEFQRTIQRLNTALDAAEARAKAIEKAKGGKP